MGIDVHGYKFLKRISESKPLDKTLFLGVPEIHISDLVFDKLGIKSPNDYHLEDKNAQISSAVQFAKLNFGVTEVDFLDMSNYEGANIIQDLNFEVSAELHRKYDTVVDLGTIEHVFDVKQALKNIQNLLKLEGRAIHVNPTSAQSGHGLYQFSPDLYDVWYSEERGFLNTEIYLARVNQWDRYFIWKPSADTRRIQFRSSTPTYCLAVSQMSDKISDMKTERANQREYQARWDGSFVFSSSAVKKPSKWQARMKKHLGPFLPLRVLQFLYQMPFSFSKDTLEDRFQAIKA